MPELVKTALLFTGTIGGSAIGLGFVGPEELREALWLFVAVAGLVLWTCRAAI